MNAFDTFIRPRRARVVLFCFAAFTASCIFLSTQAIAEPSGPASIDGQQDRWHRVTLTFDGPAVRETGEPNPFLDYRMQVIFTHKESGAQFAVPGFFAADGDAARTGANAGDQWRVRFMPDRLGEWRYEARFETGDRVAVADSFGTGRTTAFHGATGRFTVDEEHRPDEGFRHDFDGLIKHTGGHYLRDSHKDRSNVFLKGGANVPENFFGYTGFDGTTNDGGKGPDTSDGLHHYQPHVRDWSEGDPNWQRNDASGNGKGIIGAVNYLASTGVNSIYFLPMNKGGDGRDTTPTLGKDVKTRYDVSKLAQWEIVMHYAQGRGLFLHFQLAETETGNENFFDDGELGPQRKLFYRELIARFAHHPGLQWDIGEENDFGTQKRKAFAAFIKSLDPYDHPLTTHTRTNQFEKYYEPLLGNADFDMTGFQTSHSHAKLAEAVTRWRRRSAAADEPWVISVDEPQAIEADLDDLNKGLRTVRRRFVWPTLMGGGGGVELYIRADGGSHSLDQKLENLRRLEPALSQLGHAVSFSSILPGQANVTLAQMKPADKLVRGEDSAHGGAQVLAKPGKAYLIYFPDASNDDNPRTKGSIRPGRKGPPELNLGKFKDKPWMVMWFNPRTGATLRDFEHLTFGDEQWVSLGRSPSGFGIHDDWVALVYVNW